jgi:hypothetical protein
MALYEFSVPVKYVFVYVCMYVYVCTYVRASALRAPVGDSLYDPL